MGIMIPIVRMLLREHRREPLTGDALLIGRQTIPLSADEAHALISEEGVCIRNPSPALDATTRVGKGQGYISDLGFFSMFSDARFKTLDVTDYEGAEIIHDMHVPIPGEWAEQFDVVWNGSCLDNMFDPATAMKSTARMLRPGGRAICMEMGSPHFDAYTMYSQSWFFDFFAINNFDRCEVYSCIFDPADVWTGPYEVYVPTTYEAAASQFPLECFPGKALITVTIAQRGKSSTWDRMPIQGQYRPDHEPYRAAFARFGQRQHEAANLVRSFGYIGRLASIPGRGSTAPAGAVPGEHSPHPAWARRISQSLERYPRLRKPARNIYWAVAAHIDRFLTGTAR